MCVCVWPSLLAREAEEVHKSTMKLLRQLVANGADGVVAHISDEEVLSRAGVTSPLNMVSLARLVFFARCASIGNSSILLLMFAARTAKTSWLRAIQGTLTSSASTVACLSL